MNIIRGCNGSNKKYLVFQDYTYFDDSMSNDTVKKRLLVLTSTFPRWSGDTTPPFVYELSKRLTSDFEIFVLAPHSPKSLFNEEMDQIEVFRYAYFFSQFENLAGDKAINEVLKQNWFYYLLIPFLLLSQLFNAIYIARKYRIEIVQAHWIIPQGLIALALKLLFRTPYIVTSHGGDIFSYKSKLFTKLKKIVIKYSNSITVVSTSIKNEVLRIDARFAIKCKVIPMGVDTKLFNPDRYEPQIKQEYGLDGPFYCL